MAFYFVYSGDPMGRRFALGAAVLAFLMAFAGSASASTGQFTKAEAAPDWTTGSFAGNANWDRCVHRDAFNVYGVKAKADCLHYNIWVFVEPATYTCDAEDWLSSDHNISGPLWSANSQTSNQNFNIEANDVRLLQGVFGQKLCMIGVESINYYDRCDLLCEELGGGGSSGELILSTLLAQKVFSVAAPPPPESPSAPPPPPPPESPSAPPPSTAPSTETEIQACKLARKRVRRLRKGRHAARKAGERRKVKGLNKALRRARRQQQAKC